MCLTNSTRIPIGNYQSFPSAASVGSYFGLSSHEAFLAGVYFNGFDNSNIKPGAMLMAQYNQAAVSAYLRGGSVAALTLTQLQAFSGTLDITVDGYPFVAGSFSLSAATSFSSAATEIQTALNTTLPVAATASLCTISGTTLTVGGTITGTFAPGQTVTGASVTADSIILGQLTGSPSGGAGTYQLSQTSTVGVAEAMTATGTPVVVTYDSVSGAFVVTSGASGAPSAIGFATGTIAASLALTQATGAVLSQGAAAASPGTFMTALAGLTQNWVTFFTTFDPDASGNANKLAFAAWTSGQSNRYAYICQDTDITPTESTSATGSLGYLIAQDSYSGTCLIYSPTDIGLAAFVSGSAASVDYSELNGAITFDFKSQTGLVAQVTSESVAANLTANGYNYYGAWATANQQFVFFDTGQVSGKYLWLDAFINQVWLNNALQLALMTLLTALKSLPYGTAGAALIKAACADPIAQGNNFGMFQAGVALSAAQIAEVNYAAGLKIDTTLTNQGWYLQVLPATAQARSARTSPPITLWYVYRESVQSIALASIEVQ
jgi:hypothetical protein